LDVLTPTNVTVVSSVSSIDVGQDHTCAVSAGAVRCWGANYDGVLGNGTTTSSTSAVTATGVSGAVQVSSAGSTTCARTSAGAVYCWGSGSSGATANPAAFAAVPVQVVNL
jgi:alpha-tubulin suppressor-like RCC1 family protein